MHMFLEVYSKLNLYTVCSHVPLLYYLCSFLPSPCHSLGVVMDQVNGFPLGVERREIKGLMSAIMQFFFAFSPGSNGDNGRRVVVVAVLRYETKFRP